MFSLDSKGFNNVTKVAAGMNQTYILKFQPESVNHCEYLIEFEVDCERLTLPVIGK